MAPVPRPRAAPIAEAPGAGGALLTSPHSPEARAGLAAMALKLRDEQIRARVTYFGSEQETNEELDAITAAVVAEVYALQQAGASATASQKGPDIEKELIRHLRVFLDKLFSTRRKAFLRRKNEEIQRRISAKFFSSELFSGSAAALEQVEVSWADQAVFYALKKHEAGIVGDLHLLKYVQPGIREEAVTRLKQFENELRMAFLSRTTPELEKILGLLRDVMTTFFRQFRKDLATFATAVIRESHVAEVGALGYKIGPNEFRAFREVFDQKFLDALMSGVSEPVLERANAMTDVFRPETLRFLNDPQILLEIASVMCDACYDYLHGEGYLDLPAEWRAHLDRAP